MTKVITVPDSIDVPGFRVFLAGAIDMGAAEEWQRSAIAKLAHLPDDLVLINPRWHFMNHSVDQQILWEMDALEKVNLILMYLPAASKAPVSFFEAGLYWKSSTFIIGAADGFYRRRNLELAAERYGVILHNNLDSLIDAALDRFDHWNHILDER